MPEKPTPCRGFTKQVASREVAHKENKDFPHSEPGLQTQVTTTCSCRAPQYRSKLQCRQDRQLDSVLLYTRPCLLLQKTSCFMLPALFLLSSAMAAHHSTQKQNKAQPPLPLQLQHNLGYSCPIWCTSPVKQPSSKRQWHCRAVAAKLPDTQSLTLALKQNLCCHKSRWFSFLHPRVFCTGCWQALC